MEYVWLFVNAIAAIVAFLGNIILWPTSLGFPIGTIFQIIYLVAAYWIYRKRAPDWLQAWVREQLKPLVGWVVDEARDFIASSIQTKRTRDEDAVGAQAPRGRGCSLTRMMYVFIAGGLFVLALQYVLWPYYIRPTLPF